MTKASSWASYWNARSFKRWLTEKARDIYFADVFAGAVKSFVKEGLVLEAGCGSAKILERLDGRYATVGCDISFDAAKMAKDRCKNIVVCDICNLPFKSGVFKLVFNQGVMEHFDESEASRVLDEFRRVSAKILVIVPSSTSIFRLYNPFADTPHATFFSGKRLSAMLKDKFETIRVRHLVESFFLSIAGYGSND